MFVTNIIGFYVSSWILVRVGHLVRAVEINKMMSFTHVLVVCCVAGKCR
jgi:hypothetical protein